MAEILQVNNLVTQFNTEAGLVKAVDGLSFHIKEQEIISIVGESGCGKSVSCLSVMQLVRPPGKIVEGEVLFQDKNLLEYEANDSEMRAIRGADIAMIFQEPMTSLNPVLTIGHQLSEMLIKHENFSKEDALKRVVELMELVGIPDAENRVNAYPHQFSGGMRQRVMIAMALSCNPKVLIADEPTTALDVTTQAQLLKLMTDLVQRLHTSLIIVTHNLGLVARYAERIYVMYAGRVIESGTTKEIFANPRHPYTLGLLRCVPRLDDEEGRKLEPIDGLPPNLINMPPTCAFMPRCSRKQDVCRREPWPALEEVSEGHFVSCYVKSQEKAR
ncbi:MAG: ABC transporter ATP-binding protein [Firmicutes bacterium]|nr:ABC transporter ATP-binding protein [Bacillota bacterium]